MRERWKVFSALSSSRLGTADQWHVLTLSPSYTVYKVSKSWLKFFACCTGSCQGLAFQSFDLTFAIHTKLSSTMPKLHHFVPVRGQGPRKRGIEEEEEEEEKKGQFQLKIFVQREITVKYIHSRYRAPAQGC